MVKEETLFDKNKARKQTVFELKAQCETLSNRKGTVGKTRLAERVREETLSDGNAWWKTLSDGWRGETLSNKKARGKPMSVEKGTVCLTE
jgi:hypothetical protein